jgi:predicted O-methyltransferase YrrM
MSLKIQGKDVLVVAIAAVAGLVTSVTSYLLVGTLDWALAATVLGILLIGLILEERRRQQERQQKFLKALDDTYSQIESLLSVRSELGIDGDIPTTRGWAASPDFLRELVRIIRTRKPEQVVEAGSGVSTIITALALQKNGMGNTIALENGSEFANETRSDLERHQIESHANVVHAPLTRHVNGDSEYTWYDTSALKGCGPIDLLIVDGPPALQDPTSRFPALPLLLDHLSPDAVILMDDGDRQGEKEVVEKWCAEYELEASYLPLEDGAYLLKRRNQ